MFSISEFYFFFNFNRLEFLKLKIKIYFYWLFNFAFFFRTLVSPNFKTSPNLINKNKLFLNSNTLKFYSSKFLKLSHSEILKLKNLIYNYQILQFLNFRM